MENSRRALRRTTGVCSDGCIGGQQDSRAGELEVAGAAERCGPAGRADSARTAISRSRARDSGGVGEGGSEIRVLFRRVWRSEGNFQEREEGYGRRAVAGCRAARADFGCGGYFGFERPYGQRRAGENREPGGDRRRCFRRENESEGCVCGWELVRGPRGSACCETRRQKACGRRQRQRRAFARDRGGGPMTPANSLKVTLAFAAAVAIVAAPTATRAQNPGTILIQNATVMTVTHGNIEHGSILIRDGKIAAVGTDLKAPEGAAVIDATGQYVIPGIIDCHSHIAVDGSVNEGAPAVSSMANIKDVLNPDDIDIYRDLAGGVTTANILHGSANPIGGQTIVIKLRWGKPASKLPFEGALPGIKFALGENPKRSNFSIPGQPKRYPASRMGVEETIRGAFTEARDYKNSWDAYNKKVAAGEKNVLPPRRDLRLEPLVEVLERSEERRVGK